MKPYLRVDMQILRGQFTRKNTEDITGFSRILPLSFSFSPVYYSIVYFHIFFTLDVLHMFVYFHLSNVDYSVVGHCLTNIFLPFHPSPIRFRS